jgi:hypothetical protein
MGDRVAHGQLRSASGAGPPLGYHTVAALSSEANCPNNSENSASAEFQPVASSHEIVQPQQELRNRLPLMIRASHLIEVECEGDIKGVE